MKYSNKLSRSRFKASCVAIGSFDGVHYGHQVLINRMLESAKALNVPSVVINFYPQPIVVFKNLQRDFYISTLKERIDQIAELGVDYMITIPFTEKLGEMSAEKFLRRLKRRLGMKELWVGEDFALGRDRDADVNHIREIGEKFGFELNAIKRVRQGGADVSSSVIRELLRVGYLEGAEEFLGRPFTIYGPVIHGAARGRTLGYPTANVAISPLRVALRMGYIGHDLPLMGSLIRLQPAWARIQPSFILRIHRSPLKRISLISRGTSMIKWFRSNSRSSFVTRSSSTHWKTWLISLRRM